MIIRVTHMTCSFTPNLGSRTEMPLSDSNLELWEVCSMTLRVVVDFNLNLLQDIRSSFIVIYFSPSCCYTLLVHEVYGRVCRQADRRHVVVYLDGCWQFHKCQVVVISSIPWIMEDSWDTVCLLRRLCQLLIVFSNPNFPVHGLRQWEYWTGFVVVCVSRVQMRSSSQSHEDEHFVFMRQLQEKKGRRKCEIQIEMEHKKKENFLSVNGIMFTMMIICLCLCVCLPTVFQLPYNCLTTIFQLSFNCLMCNRGTSFTNFNQLKGWRWK